MGSRNVRHTPGPELLAEVRLLLGTRSDEEIAVALDKSTSAIGKAARVAGDLPLARRFENLYRRSVYNSPENTARRRKYRDQRIS